MIWDTTYDIRRSDPDSLLLCDTQGGLTPRSDRSSSTTRTLAEELIACKEHEFIDEKDREAAMARLARPTSFRVKAKIGKR